MEVQLVLGFEPNNTEAKALMPKVQEALTAHRSQTSFDQAETWPSSRGQKSDGTEGRRRNWSSEQKMKCRETPASQAAFTLLMMLWSFQIDRSFTSRWTT